MPKGVVPFCLKGVIPFCLKGVIPFCLKGVVPFLLSPPHPFASHSGRLVARGGGCVEARRALSLTVWKWMRGLESGGTNFDTPCFPLLEKCREGDKACLVSTVGWGRGRVFARLCMPLRKWRYAWPVNPAGWSAVRRPAPRCSRSRGCRAAGGRCFPPIR